MSYNVILSIETNSSRIDDIENSIVNTLLEHSSVVMKVFFIEVHIEQAEEGSCICCGQKRDITAMDAKLHQSTSVPFRYVEKNM